MKHRTHKGFTLIELLVVIAIIAILAAILFPVFAKARMKAHQTTCVNNMKQIGIAFSSYVSDNDEKFPLWKGPGRTGGISVEDYYATLNYPVDLSQPAFEKATISQQLDPYMKSKAVWACPTDFGAFKDAGINDWARGVSMLPFKDWPLRGSRQKVGVSYGYRGTNVSQTGPQAGYVTQKDPTGWSLAFYGMSNVRTPAALPVFWDHRAWHYSGKGANLAEYNKGRVVELFLDTHVQAVSIQEFNSVEKGYRRSVFSN